MKVAYFIGSLNRGGTEMLTLDICRKKDYAPYEMILIYRNEGELSEVFRETGVKMFRIKPKGLKIGYLFQLRKLLKAEQVDLVHAQTFVNSRIVLMATSFSTIRCVSSFHGFSFAQAPLLARRFVMKRSDGLVFVSRYVRDYYLQRNTFCNEKKCNVVYNGIDSEKFEQKYPAPGFLEAKDSIKPKRIKLTMVGNFVDVRSQIVICRSIKLLKEQGVDNFDFYFVGKRVESEASLYDDCVCYCEENGLTDIVHFMGSRGDIPSILQHVDGFVYSTDHDTFGIAVVEALLAGLPVIANDWVVMKEISREGEFMTLFETENEVDCCAKMRTLIENIDVFNRETKDRIDTVKNMFSIEKHIDGITAVYEKCCGM